MEETIDDVVNELVKLLAPKNVFIKCPQNVSENDKKNMISNNMKSDLDYIRLAVKYNLFDLEATKRQNEYLLKSLEENE